MKFDLDAAIGWHGSSVNLFANEGSVEEVVRSIGEYPRSNPFLQSIGERLSSSVRQGILDHCVGALASSLCSLSYRTDVHVPIIRERLGDRDVQP